MLDPHDVDGAPDDSAPATDSASRTTAPEEASALSAAR
jgi:hypothetical protein